MSKLEVNTALSVVDYMAMVENIVSEYFDEDGEYTPQYGRLNAMRLFYNHCVQDDIGGLSHNISEATEMQALTDSEDFVDAYNYYVYEDYENVNALNFGNAVRDAMDIVKVRTQSLNQAVTILKNGVAGMINMIAPLFSQDNLDKLEKIAADISSGKISSETLADAVANSDLIMNLAAK